MKSLLAYTIVVAISSAAGAISYSICRRFPPNHTVFIFALLMCFMWVGYGDGWFTRLGALLILGVCSNLGAWGHRLSTPFAEVDSSKISKISYRVGFTATVLSFLLGPSVAFLLFLLLMGPGGFGPIGLVEAYFQDVNEGSVFLAVVLALLLTPSLTPFFIWGRQKIKARKPLGFPFEG